MAWTLQLTEVMDAQRNRVRGYVLKTGRDSEQGGVEKRDLPLPKVVYDQILSRKYENSMELGAAIATPLPDRQITLTGG